MRSRSRRPSLALGARSSSCASSALTGSAAVLPTDVCSSLPEAEAASSVPPVGAAFFAFPKLAGGLPPASAATHVLHVQAVSAAGARYIQQLPLWWAVSVSLLHAAEVLLPSAGTGCIQLACKPAVCWEATQLPAACLERPHGLPAAGP